MSRCAVAAIAVLLSCATGCRSSLISLAGPDAASDGTVMESRAPREASFYDVPPFQPGTPLPPPDGGRACEKSDDCTWWQCPDPRSLCCAGQCKNTRDDPGNCGGCGIACPDGQLCAEGECRPAVAVCGTLTCDPGWICCGGSCVKPSLWSNNCGGCAVECRFSGAGCFAGICCPAADPDAGCDDLACPEGLVRCAEGCRDISENPLSCGACGHVCPPDRPRCVAGNCRL